MSDTEIKAFRQIGVDLINEYRARGGFKPISWLAINTPEVSAFIRSIQLHEKTKKELRDIKQEFDDFKQKVSDAVEMALKNYPPTFLREHLHQFIIPAVEPDPLVDVLLEMDLSSDPEEGQHDAKWLRIKLDALGFEIREKNDE